MQRERISRLSAASAAIACGALLAALPAMSQVQDKALGATIAVKGGSNGAAACASCHGAKGEGNVATGFPRLAEMRPGYVEEQLNSIADNRRQNPIMAPIPKHLTAAERKAVATYFGLLPGLAGIYAGNDAQLKASDTGAWLATRGR